MKKAKLTHNLVQQLLRKAPEVWAIDRSRSRAASVIALDGELCVELRVKRTPPELASKIFDEKTETAELIFWQGQEKVFLPLSSRIHARAVELWQSIAMTPAEIERAKASYSPFACLRT